jgi:hypothetical protein
LNWALAVGLLLIVPSLAYLIRVYKAAPPRGLGGVHPHA